MQLVGAGLLRIGDRDQVGYRHHRDQDRQRQVVPVHRAGSVRSTHRGLVHATPAGSADGDPSCAMAVWRCQDSESLILHSDRAASSEAVIYQNYLAANGLVRSMSEVGHYGDNRRMRRLLRPAQARANPPNEVPDTRCGKGDVFEYIERFHNPRMRRRVASQDLKFSALSHSSVISGRTPLFQLGDRGQFVCALMH